MFLMTAAVFYHQSVKFLDIRYASLPLAQAHPCGFAIDYIQLVLTAAPFFLMANSLRLDSGFPTGMALPQSDWRRQSDQSIVATIALDAKSSDPQEFNMDRNRADWG